MSSFHTTAGAPHRRALALLTTAGLAAVTGGALIAAPALADPAPTTVTYSCTGGAQAWVVPAGVTSATFVLDGAAGGQGGGNGTAAAAGAGGELQATLPVTPGDAYTVMVGCQGADRGAGGFNGGGAGGQGQQFATGGGGGGATDVRRGSSDVADRVLVAGGGGGSSASGNLTPGAHGASAGGSGSGGGSGATQGAGDPGRTGGGQPGVTNAAGSGGANLVSPGPSNGQAGSGATGGAGGTGLIGGGGGGGGWYGGGGGAAPNDSQSAGGGGGGGSGYAVGGATGVTATAGAHSGNGSVTISFVAAAQQASPPTITGTPPVGNAGTPYSFAFPVSGSPTCSVTAGSLPAGLVLDPATCVLSGTPTTGGAFPFTVTAANAVDPAAAVSPTLTVDQAPSTDGGLHLSVQAGAPASVQVPLIGYPAPTVTVRPLTPLPAGLSMDEHGLITGVPTAPTQYPLFISLLLQNSVGQGAGGFLLDVAPIPPARFTSGPPADVVAGQPYSFTFTATGIPAPTFSVISGNLPAGLTLDGTSGVLSGTTTDVGDFPLLVIANDGSGEDAQAITLHVSGSAASISGSPSAGVVGQAYDFGYLLGGAPAPTVSVTAGALPPGLSLGVDGHLTGTPTTAGSYAFTVTADNGVGTATSDATITVAPAVAPPAPVTIAGTPSSGGVGEPYSFTFLTAGTPRPTVTLSAGALPAGLTLSPAGTLAGTPRTAGTYRFTVQAANGTGSVATRAVTLQIRSLPTVGIGDAAVREGNAGTTGLAFTVSLSRASTVPVTVHWATADGTAKAGSDYVAGAGTMTFAPGQTTGTITVMVKGDRTVERNETFTVHLAHSSPATLARSVATGTVVNDD